MSSAREKTREGRPDSARDFKEEGRADSRSDKLGLIVADISQEFQNSENCDSSICKVCVVLCFDLD